MFKIPTCFTVLLMSAMALAQQPNHGQTDFLHSGFCVRYVCRLLSQSPYGSTYTGYNHIIYQYALAGAKRLTLITDRKNIAVKADLELTVSSLNVLVSKQNMLSDFTRLSPQNGGNGNKNDCLLAIKSLEAAQAKKGLQRAILTRSKNCMVGYDVTTRRYVLAIRLNF